VKPFRQKGAEEQEKFLKIKTVQYFREWKQGGEQ
jgi:hypothetical protein